MSNPLLGLVGALVSLLIACSSAQIPAATPTPPRPAAAADLLRAPGAVGISREAAETQPEASLVGRAKEAAEVRGWEAKAAPPPKVAPTPED